MSTGAQELRALLTVYQLIRMAMTTATESVPGTATDRASFTAALETARRPVTAARGITGPGDPADTGRIGRAVLDSLQPARRARYSARKVKYATSRYLNRDDGRPQQTTVITRVEITILTPPPDRPAARSRTPQERPGRASSPPAQARYQTRQDHPDHGQRTRTRLVRTRTGGRARRPPQVMLTQLAEWTRLGLLAKTGARPVRAPCCPAQPGRNPDVTHTG